jgi:RNA polymerase sigma-70 factor (ECF subfamily)
LSSEAITSKQLEELRYKLRNYGERRFPALREEIDDLTNQALSDLWEYLQRLHKTQNLDLQSIHRIAFSIFRRRAIDVFRKTAKLWVVDMESLSEEEQADPRSKDEVKSDLLQRMLRICIAELTEASEEDRALLAVIIGIGPDRERAMDARDRQRLHRLRQRLTAAIHRVLGEDAKMLIREDF